MKLTSKQIEYVNNEREILRRILETKPIEGLISYGTQYEALGLIIKLHNMALKEEKENG